MGCDKAVSEAITWFFEHVERGIILEDDCVPSPSFFYFCQAMLERYKDEEKVWNILGVNYYGTEDTYFFSTEFFPTGWASWRRAWQYFDPFSALHNKNTTPLDGLHKKTLSRLRSLQRKARMGVMDLWDVTWIVTTNFYKKLCICPPVNMVDHSLGHGPDSVHFQDVDPLDIRSYTKAYDFDITLLNKPVPLIAKYTCRPSLRKESP